MYHNYFNQKGRLFEVLFQGHKVVISGVNVKGNLTGQTYELTREQWAAQKVNFKPANKVRSLICDLLTSVENYVEILHV